MSHHGEQSPPSTSSPRRQPRQQQLTRDNSRRASLPAHLHSGASPYAVETRERSRDRASLHTRPTSHAHPPRIRFPAAQPASDLESYEVTAGPLCDVNAPDEQSRPRYGSPRRSCSTPRPKLVERPCSTIYTTFPIRPPRTPGDGPADDEENGAGDWRRWLSWIPSARRASQNGDLERAALVSDMEQEQQRDRQNLDSTSACVRHKEGLPKLSRECFVAEVKCYGRYMLPPILVFVALALSVALYTYQVARGRQVEDP